MLANQVTVFPPWYAATSSSVFEDHSPGQAVDGVPSEKTCFWSAPDESHWWSVDLGNNVLITKIRITNSVRWASSRVAVCVSVSPIVYAHVSTTMRSNQRKAKQKQNYIYSLSLSPLSFPAPFPSLFPSLNGY